MEDDGNGLFYADNANEPPKKTFAQNRVPPRITVVESVYHQLPNEQPTQVGSPFAKELTSDEEPFLRRLTATEEWKPLDFGWIKSLSLVHIENREGTRLAVRPEVDEQADIASRILEIGFGGPGADSPTHDNRIVILPGTSCRFALASVDGVLIRCQHGQAKFYMAAFPG